MPDRRRRRHFIGDGDVGLALVKLAKQIVVMDCLEIEFHILMRAQEARHCGRERVQRERRQRRYAQGTARPPLQIPPRLAQCVNAILYFADFGEERMRVFGRHQPAIGPLEQLESEQSLGVPKHLRHRRLRHVQSTRGGTDRAVHIDGVEYLDVAQFHKQLLWSIVAA
jgi:hypothetical protein